MKKNTADKCLDPQLWHACAGGMVQMPPLNSKVFYFPQGHAEHAQGAVDFGNSQNTPPPPLILCRLAGIKYMADPDTDEVFARITLVPLKPHSLDPDDDGDNWLMTGHGGAAEVPDKAASFAKTLTQSDANNGGGFSVPRYCAETIFPRLDYSAEPPVQTVIAKDVHGESWKFRHIYRGTPRRHLLTTGWSNFVNRKKLVAGDSIVFLRSDGGDLCVGIRRAKRGGFGGSGGFGEYGSGWNSSPGPFGGYNGPISKGTDGASGGKVAAEMVVRAAALAAAGRPFEVVYYPRAGSPEFFVKAGTVTRSMRMQWCSGMRFKMPFETEDSSRISWFMGTISAVQVADPVRWPNSPWRLLQVVWDEPDLLQNVKRVSPWLVELVSTIPPIHHHLISPFSPPRKKLRPPSSSDFSIMDQLQLQLPSNFPTANHPILMSQQPNSPLCYVPDSSRSITPAVGIQGARHAHYYGPSDNPNLRKLHPSCPIQNYDFAPQPPQKPGPNRSNLSCLLTMATAPPDIGEKKAPHILLFGQLIVTDNPSSETTSSGPPESSSEEDNLNVNDGKKGMVGLGIETGHCKVFMESEDVGRTLDLSVLGSYDELYTNLAEMFGIEGSEKMLRNILYRDAAGAVKHAGEEPFSDFLKTAKRLTIPAGSSIGEVGR